MAYNYQQTQVLSRIKIGEDYHYLKDADARAILDTFNNDIVTGTIANSISDTSSGKLATEGIVKSYVDAQIGAINKFDVTVVSSLPTASAETMYIIYLVPASRENITNNAKAEYITIRKGSEGAYTYDWEKIGDTELDLTNYLDTTATVAGVAFGADKGITAEEIQTALGLGLLAYKDSATVTVNDYVTDIVGQDYTPAGDVSLQQTTNAAVTYNETTDVNISVSAAASTGDYTPSGTITLNPTYTTVSEVTNAGTAYSITEGSVTQGADTKSAFATNGVIASVGTGTDAETLVFTNATTSNAVTASGGVTYTAPVLSGAIPTFGASQQAVTGFTSTSFQGDAVDIAATPVSATSNATVTQPAFTATFEGTQETIAPTLTKGNKVITVS